jgi:hypothetical protein
MGRSRTGYEPTKRKLTPVLVSALLASGSHRLSLGRRGRIQIHPSGEEALAVGFRAEEYVGAVARAEKSSIPWRAES